MSERGEPDLTRLLRDLTRELQTLQREIENRDRRDVSTRQQLSRFTSEVAIPGLILLLETNIRALKLLRRTIRLADGRDPRESDSGTAAAELRDRAERLGTASLSRLDETLAEVQSSLEDGGDDDIQPLVAEARELQQEIRDRVEESGADGQPADTGGQQATGAESGESAAGDHVTIDVESELRTLKDDLEDGSDGPETTSEDEGDSSAEDDNHSGGDDDNHSDADDDSDSDADHNGDSGPDNDSDRDAQENGSESEESTDDRPAGGSDGN